MLMEGDGIANYSMTLGKPEYGEEEEEEDEGCGRRTCAC